MAFDPNPDIGELRPAQRLGEGADLVLRGRGQRGRAVAEGEAQVDAARLGRTLRRARWTGRVAVCLGRGGVALGAVLVVRDSEKPRVAETRGSSGFAGSAAALPRSRRLGALAGEAADIIVGGRRLALLGESGVGNQHH